MKRLLGSKRKETTFATPTGHLTQVVLLTEANRIMFTTNTGRTFIYSFDFSNLPLQLSNENTDLLRDHTIIWLKHN